MPSPLAHTAAGYLLRRTAFGDPAGVRLIPAFAFLSLLPDLDAVPGYLRGDLFNWHNNFSHSLAAGTAAAFLIGLAAALAKSTSPRRWALAALLCWWTHLAMDFFTVGRGVMLLWPLSTARFASPVKLFYGLRWSAGTWSTHHLVTAATEALFMGSLLLLLRQGGRRACGKIPSG